MSGLTGPISSKSSSFFKAIPAKFKAGAARIGGHRVQQTPTSQSQVVSRVSSGALKPPAEGIIKPDVLREKKVTSASEKTESNLFHRMSASFSKAWRPRSAMIERAMIETKAQALHSQIRTLIKSRPVSVKATIEQGKLTITTEQKKFLHAGEIGTKPEDVKSAKELLKALEALSKDPAISEDDKQTIQSALSDLVGSAWFSGVINHFPDPESSIQGTLGSAVRSILGEPIGLNETTWTNFRTQITEKVWEDISDIYSTYKKSMPSEEKLNTSITNFSQDLAEPIRDFGKTASLYKEAMGALHSGKNFPEGSEVRKNAAALEHTLNEVCDKAKKECQVLKERTSVLFDAGIRDFPKLRADIDSLSIFTHATYDLALRASFGDLERTYNEQVLAFAKGDPTSHTEGFITELKGKLEKTTEELRKILEEQKKVLTEEQKKILGEQKKILTEEQKKIVKDSGFGALLQGLAEPTRKALFVQCEEMFKDAPESLEHVVHEFKMENLRRCALMRFEPEEFAKRSLIESNVKGGASEKFLREAADGALYGLVGYAGNLKDVVDLFKELAGTLPDASLPVFREFFTNWAKEFSTLDYTEPKVEAHYSAVETEVNYIAQIIQQRTRTPVVLEKSSRSTSEPLTSGDKDVQQLIHKSDIPKKGSYQGSEEVASDLDLIFCQSFLSLDSVSAMVSHNSASFTSEGVGSMDKLSYLIPQSIIQDTQAAAPEKKADTLLKNFCFWIDVGLAAQEKGNTMLSFAINVGLNMNSVERLIGDASGRLALPPEYKEKFEKLQSFNSPDGSFKNIRNFAKTNPEVALIPPTVLSSDLTFMHDGNIENGGMSALINLKNKFASELSTYTKAARTKLAAHSGPLSTKIQENLEPLLKTKEEKGKLGDRLYELSLQIKPQGGQIFTPAPTAAAAPSSPMPAERKGVGGKMPPPKPPRPAPQPPPSPSPAGLKETEAKPFPARPAGPAPRPPTTPPPTPRPPTTPPPPRPPRTPPPPLGPPSTPPPPLGPPSTPPPGPTAEGASYLKGRWQPRPQPGKTGAPASSFAPPPTKTAAPTEGSTSTPPST